jgi:hypothetical protein
VPLIWSLPCVGFVILLAMDGVTEKFAKFGNIFEQAVRDSKAIVFRRSRDTFCSFIHLSTCVGSRSDIDRVELRAARLEGDGLLGMFC